MLNGKATIVVLTVGLTKKKSKIWNSFVSLCNKSRFKNGTDVDTLKIFLNGWFS